LIKAALPLVHVSNARAAEEFYCGRLGFRTEFVYRGDEAKADPCYMGLSRDGVWINVSSFSGDGVAGGVVNFFVEDVDALHAEYVGKGVRIDTGPVDQTWGSREMYVKDGDGNSLRFIQQ
jgi:catechol 2,3-dioxygenase-like lactoylglutathione lyase family enzyme